MGGTADLAESISAELVKRGLTQSAAAAELGVSQQTLSRWLSGSVQPGDDKLPALARFTDRPVDELVALRSPRGAAARAGMSRRVADLEDRSATFETRLARLAERLEMLAARLDRLADR